MKFVSNRQANKNTTLETSEPNTETGVFIFDKFINTAFNLVDIAVEDIHLTVDGGATHEEKQEDIARWDGYFKEGMTRWENHESNFEEVYKLYHSKLDAMNSTHIGTAITPLFTSSRYGRPIRTDYPRFRPTITYKLLQHQPLTPELGMKIGAKAWPEIKGFITHLVN